MQLLFTFMLNYENKTTTEKKGTQKNSARPKASRIKEMNRRQKRTTNQPNEHKEKFYAKK